MFCRICGEKIPDDSLFCPRCGREVVLVDQDPPVEEAISALKAIETQVFAFSEQTTYDQASVPVNQWLSERGIRIQEARFTVDAILLAGTMVPVVQRIEIDWTADDTDKHYQLGVMLDSRSDFGLGRKKGAAQLQRQFDRWSQQHPEYEVAGKQDCQMSLGWTSAWATFFFYR